MAIIISSCTVRVGKSEIDAHGLKKLMILVILKKKRMNCIKGGLAI